LSEPKEVDRLFQQYFKEDPMILLFTSVLGLDQVVALCLAPLILFAVMIDYVIVIKRSDTVWRIVYELMITNSDRFWELNPELKPRLKWTDPIGSIKAIAETIKRLTKCREEFHFASPLVVSPYYNEPLLRVHTFLIAMWWAWVEAISLSLLSAAFLIGSVFYFPLIYHQMPSSLVRAIIEYCTVVYAFLHSIQLVLFLLHYQLTGTHLTLLKLGAMHKRISGALLKARRGQLSNRELGRVFRTFRAHHLALMTHVIVVSKQLVSSFWMGTFLTTVPIGVLLQAMLLFKSDLEFSKFIVLHSSTYSKILNAKQANAL